MKKRIISMLLTVLMVMSLFSGLTVTADAANYNGANVIEYTMAQGDFVLRICQRLGLNYYTCKNAIMILNNITDGQWNKLTVGRTLRLPASDYDALLISNGAGTSVYNSGAASTTATTSNVTGTATVGNATVFNTAATVAAASSDTLAYYLVPYTMSYGETVSGVCNALGVNFSIFSPFIKQVNNISNWNRVRAGDTLIIPTPVAPSVGTTCYGVMEHIVAGSDTAYGIVSSKGVNYNANERLLKVLNQTDNLAAIKAGGKFFYPVPLTVSVPGTGNPGATSTTTTTTTVTDGNGTTTTSTTTTAKLYKLSSGMAASDGQMLFYVDNKAVTAAPAGAKVTIVTQANSGKAIQRLTVKHANGTADLLLAGDAFVMPSCDVRVDAVIKNGHDINIAANYSGKATASVGGVSVQAAVKGATVVIKSTDPNYEISSVYATYKKMISSSTKIQLTVSASKAFIMPDADVDVEVVLKPVSTYAFYVNDPANGSFYLQVDGSPVTRAAKGAQVTVVAKPDTGYEPLKMSVKNHLTGAAVNVFSNTFTMPAFDVDVEVEFTGKGNNILVMPSQFGNVYAFDSKSITDASQFITEAETGKEIYLVAINEDGAAPVGLVDGGTSPNSKISYDVVRNSDGLKVKVTKGGDNWAMTVDGTNTTSSYYHFTMPKGGVTVTPVITSSTASEIYAKFFVNNTPMAAGSYNDCSFSITWNGKTSEFTETLQQISKIKAIKSAIPAGEYLDLRYDSAEGVSFVKFRITDGKTNPTVFEEATNEANRYGYFKMPAAPIEIEAYFETGKAALGPAVITGVGTVTYRNAANTLSINSCDPGETVLISVVPGNGFSFDYQKYADRLIVTRRDNGARVTINPANVVPAQGIYVYSFTMPASGVDVQAIFDAKPFVITMRCVDETGKSLTGLGLWQVAVNMQPGVVDNDPTKTETKFTVAYEDYVTVAMTEAGWSKYDMVSFRVDGQQYTADSLNFFYNFQMIEDRAKDLEIVAVLRPRVANVPSPHRLLATYLPTMGDVEFFLFEGNPVTGGDKGTGYASNIDGVNYYAVMGKDAKGNNIITNARYTSYALAGDYVAVMVNANDSHYTASANDIVISPIQGDADRLVVNGPVPVASIDGDTNNGNGFMLYYFRMPDSDLNISVNFKSQKYAMTVDVRDQAGNKIGGMIDLYVETSVFSDVAADRTFGDISFNQLVTIMPSTRARSENMIVSKVDVKTDPGAQSVYYYDYSATGTGTATGSGPVFYMPASNVTVYITVDTFTPVNVINLQHMLEGGSLVIRSGPAMTDPVLLTVSGNRQVSLNVTEFSVGDDIYVFEVPDAGKAHLGKGDLGITNNGIVYTVANWYAEAGDGTNIWKVKVPAGMMVFTATWGDPEEAPGADNLIYAPASSIIGGTLQFYLEQDTVDYPDLTKPATEYRTDKYLYILATNTVENKKPSEEDIVVLDSDYKRVPVKESKNASLQATAGTNSKWFYLDKNLTEGGIAVSAEFTAPGKSITFTLAAGSPAASLNLGSRAEPLTAGNDVTLTLNARDRITISSGDSTYNMVEVKSQHYNTTLTESTVTYIAPDAIDTVTVRVFSGNPAVTLRTDKDYGSIMLTRQNASKNPTVQETSFKAGDKDIYFFIDEVPGYVVDQVKVIETISGVEHAATANGNGIYSITGITGTGIPDGGIVIGATYKAKTINVTLKVTNADGTAYANKANINVDGTLYSDFENYTTVQVEYGKTITVTAGTDSKFASDGLVSVNFGEKAVTKNTSTTRTYKVPTGDDTLEIRLDATTP